MGLLWQDSSSYPLNAAYLSRPHNIRPGAGDHYLEPNAQLNGVVLKAGTIVPLFNGTVWKVYEFTGDVNIVALDVGSFQFGKDYYVYLCDDGSTSGLLLISLNSTVPSGYNANNSRKIGGFHYGRKRNSFTVSDITNNVVVPNSVWDLVHRPRCSPEGMVYIGNGVWVDIYLVSVSETITFSAGNGSPIITGTCKSTYNSVPLTGTEGLCGYNFVELAGRTGKRLLSYAEWLRAAWGSPQGNNSDNNNAWSATTNTSRQNTGYVNNATSLMNVIDCAGNIWEWLDEYTIRQDSTSWAWYDVMQGWNVGQQYLPNNIGVSQCISGGMWSDGARCGSRTIRLIDYPSTVSANCGSRFACDSL
ncbi:SUMF1/EgtB/PvdO family nonheme iron enzyme [Thermodesulfovibrio thiophilus]|uniref:phage major tropism determinant n=1 Tax=Thermodesulfovibrio thiophilus TaxID=340095 RepID=UPI0003F9952A|nr:SUMF1/EgtB/PvdO family nonheme iron enzyme [Thermodesulfovibrio thiophilus]